MGKKIQGGIYVQMALLLVLWGSFAAVNKLVVQNLDSFQVQFYMFSAAVLVMTPFIVFGGRRKEFRGVPLKDFIKLFLFAVPSYLYYFLYTMSMKHIPAVEASMINYLFPIMIVAFSIPINGEKLDWIKLVSMFLGFAGMLIIVTRGDLQGIRMSDIRGDLLAFGAAVSWGIFSNLGKKNEVSAYISNYLYALVSFLLSTASMLLFSNFTVPSAAAFAGISYLAVSNIAIGFPLWFVILKKAPIALVASVTFITPFVTLIFIVLLLGEKISFVQVLGLIVILLGSASQNARVVSGLSKLKGTVSNGSRIIPKQDKLQ